jgi:hypothetical protein
VYDTISSISESQEALAVIRRETQTPTYWHNYQVSESDLEQITTLFIMAEQPRTVDELALAVIQYRCEQEDALIRRELAKGVPYQPGNAYEVGQTLVFPALGYAVGELVAIRPGNNPEYGDFRVAEIQFEGQEAAREFAVELQVPHRLSYESDAFSDDGQLSSEELYELHGAPVRDALESHMEQSEEFVRLAGRWFLKGLLIEINVGHLNLAEALLDMSDGGPLPTKTFLDDLDLPGEIDEQLRVFSLNYALNIDPRFDEVGPAGQILWFLHAREPEPVRDPPRRLRATTVSYDPGALDVALVMLERELDDEWSDFSYAPVDQVDQLTLTLPYPHRRVGTLPLTSRTKALFPAGRTPRIRFLFKDATTGDTWPGWVVHRHRYVFGLDQWYNDNEIPAGAYLELQRGPEPGVVEIDFRRRRPVREWVRVAVIREGRLTFEMRKRLVGCDYDELMIVTVDDVGEVDRVWKGAEEKGYPVTQVLYDIFPELSKLNPQGTVHAKTLYSAVNVIRRLPPGPIFAVLMQDMAFLPVGDNYWLFTRGG